MLLSPGSAHEKVMESWDTASAVGRAGLSGGLSLCADAGQAKNGNTATAATKRSAAQSSPNRGDVTALGMVMENFLAQC